MTMISLAHSRKSSERPSFRNDKLLILCFGLGVCIGENKIANIQSHSLNFV